MSFFLFNKKKEFLSKNAIKKINKKNVQMKMKEEMENKMEFSLSEKNFFIEKFT